jgi:hypothetical protein
MIKLALILLLGGLALERLAPAEPPLLIDPPAAPASLDAAN